MKTLAVHKLLLSTPLLLLIATTAHAEAGSNSGGEIGVRVAYGLPLGELGGGLSLGDMASSQISLALDLGYRPNPKLFLGVFARYGFLNLGDPFDAVCDKPTLYGSSRVECSGSDFGGGLQLHYHPAPSSSNNPWVGIGIGYEWLTIDVAERNSEVTSTARGFEFVNLQAGLDWSLAARAFIGPFIELSVGQFTHVSNECTGPVFCSELVAEDGEIDDTAMHGWLKFGLRFTNF